MFIIPHYPSASLNSFLPSPLLVTILLLHVISSLCAFFFWKKHGFLHVPVKLWCAKDNLIRSLAKVFI